MATGPRERMIVSAARLMSEHGVEATSFSDVLEHSGAPRGSIYHYFPRGKDQLVLEATRYAGEFVVAGLKEALDRGGPPAMVDAFGRFSRYLVTDSDFAAGCPVVAAGLGGKPAASEAAGQAFRTWQRLLSEALVSEGVPEERADSLATLTFATLEGAILFARAQRSTEPIDRVLPELRELLESALT